MKLVKETLFKNLIEALDLNSIEYAILGRTDSYPEDITSDIDIVINKRDLKKCIKVLIDLKKLNLRLVQLLQHEPTGFYFVLNFYGDKACDFIIPDICTDYLRNGKRFFTADYLMQETRIAKNDNQESKGFKILSPEKEFIYYLSKKIDKNELTQDHFEHLHNTWQSGTEANKKELKRYFSDKSFEIIKNSFETNTYKDLKGNVPKLQLDFDKRKKYSLWAAVKKYKTKFQRIIKPTGVFVVFMGPDGSGKTSVINVVKKEIAPAFRKTSQYHLFPIKAKGESKTVTNPHSSKPRNFIGSILKLCYLMYLYFSGYIKTIYPALIRSTFVVFDRYYHDILVDPIRYRNGVSAFWVKLIGVFIPKPNLWILLDVPAEELQKRKQEVSFEESKRQREAYIKLFSQLKNAHVINANNELSDVCLDVQNVILQHMHKRTLKRLEKL